MAIERMVVTNHERWGNLVKTWSTGKNYLEDDNEYPIPETVDEFKEQLAKAQVFMTVPDRFTQIMGVPAMQYLGNWRLQRAARLLERESVSVAEAAASVGYESEAAFNRAFKRQVGLPPGGWRKARAAVVRGSAVS